MVKITEDVSKEQLVDILVLSGFSLAQAQIIANGGTPLLFDVVDENGRPANVEIPYIINLDVPNG